MTSEETTRAVCAWVRPARLRWMWNLMDILSQAVTQAQPGGRAGPCRPPARTARSPSGGTQSACNGSEFYRAG